MNLHAASSRWSVCAALFMGIIAYAFTNANAPTGNDRSGHELFTIYCVRCHGEDGTKGKWGAKNLHQSQLQAADIVQRITTGKGVMPSFKKKMTPQEVERLAEYVVGLRE